MDKDGNEITTIVAYIGTLEPGKTIQLNTSKTIDCVNVMTLSITKE